MNAWQHDLVERIGLALAHTIWQGTIACIALALLLRMGGRRWNAATRHWLALTAMLSVFIAAIATAVLVQPSHSKSHQPPDALRRANPSQMLLVPGPSDVANGPLVAAPVNRFARLPQVVLPICVMIWLVGVLAIGVAHAFGWTWLQRCRRRATRAADKWQSCLASLSSRLNVRPRVSLLISDQLDVPIVIGVFKPMILVPFAVLNDLPIQHVEAILAHELVHVRRHDYLINLVVTAIETLLFYHPGVWWIARQIRTERECACDQIAADGCGDRLEYARSLTTLATDRAVRRLAPALTDRTKGALLIRMRRLLETRPRTEWPFPGAGWSTLVVSTGVIVALVVWSSRLTETALGAQSQASRMAAATRPSAGRGAQEDPTTQSMTRQLRVVVGRNVIYAFGQPMDWEGVRDIVKSLPLDVRHQFTFEVVAVNDRLTLGRFVQAQAIAEKISVEYGMAGTRNGGIATSHDFPKRYTIGGSVERAGEYSFSYQPILLKQALYAAGVELTNRFVTVSRRADLESDLKVFLNSVPIEGVIDGTATGGTDLVELRPGDAITVNNSRATDDGQTAVYYIGGSIRRSGAYQITPGRSISLKQALIAAGGTTGADGELAVTVIRQSPGRDREEWLLDNVLLVDLIESRIQDVALQANDQVMISPRKPTVGDVSKSGSAGAAATRSAKPNLEPSLLPTTRP